jgi:uncharacterized cupredoxin-like copper-binding protein
MGMRVIVVAGALGALLALVGGAPAASRPHAMSHEMTHGALSASRPHAMSHSAAAAAPAATNAVAITVKEWSVAASTKSITAGKVTFVVRNAGTMKHEFVVIRSNKHHHLLPMHGAQASEVGAKGEIEPFGPGTSSSATCRATTRRASTWPSRSYLQPRTQRRRRT